MRIIINGPSSPADTDLCLSCQYSVRRTVADSEQRFCRIGFSADLQPLPGRVTECTEYENVALMQDSRPYRELQRLAMFRVLTRVDARSKTRKYEWITYEQADERGLL